MSMRISKRCIAAITLMLVAVISVTSLAFLTDRVDHSMQFTTAKFTAEGYELTRTAPVGPFCAGEDVTATLKESNTGDDDANSVISMKATWVSPDTALSIFGNANNADNAKLSVDGANVSYKVSSDKRSITFDLPAHALAAGAKNVARDLTLTIPEAFKSTGRIDFTFEKVVVAQDGGGFSKEFSRTELNASGKLDYSVRVGWAASSIANQNGKALMGYLTDKNSSGKYGIEFEFAFNYNTSPMKDFASKTDAKWSYYKDKADRLTFVEGMSSIGDYAFPDFELVTSLSLPESLMSVGKWSFDNVSIPTLTLPAALTSFDTMSFGHINELTVITFQQAKNTSISFPTAGSTTGAFYVDPYVPTQIVGENPIAQGYDWITDQRRVAPVIRSYNYTWSGDRMSQPLDATTLTPDDNSNVDFHTAENRAKIKSVVFQDASGYYALPGMTPGDRNKVVEATANMWDVSEAQDKSVIAYLKSDGTLIIAADGVKVMANADSDWLFGDMANIETIDATLYDTSNATTLEYWHAFGEPDLRQSGGSWSGDPLPMEMPLRGTKQIVGIQDWDVSKVTSTKDMFYNANRLTSLNLGNWNTKSLKTPNGMFHGSSALTTLNVSGWNTSNVTTLQSIFSHCKALTALDVSGWDVRKVTDMSFAFSDCGAPVLDLHTWKTNSLYTLEKTFAGAAAKTINVTGWDTSKVTTMDSAFENTTNLGALNLSSWDTSAVGRCVESDGTISGTNAFNNMFYRSGAKSINVSGFDFRSFYGKGNWGGGLYNMFRECKNLTEIIGAETWTNTGKILQLYNTFQDCEKLVTLNVSTWDTSGVTSMANAFSGCKALAALDVSRWNVSSCETYINTFKDCASVKVLDISKWDMTKATASASQNMFNGCKALESLTFPEAVNWLANSMAANCPKLTTIEFLSTDDSIIQRPLAGEKLGAFYVAPDAGVTVPVVTKVITHGAGMAQLKNSSTYNWADDNRCMDDVNLPKQNGTLTYNGNTQEPDWTGYDSTKMTLSGTTSGINAGTYTAKFTPKGGYCWPDGTTDTVSVTWKINKATVSVPSQKGTLTYNGNAQTPSWNNYSTASLTLGGKTSGTNAGSYTATFTPTANYQWSDGTTTAKSASWSIGKAAGSLSISKSSATIDYNAATTTFTVTRAGDGAISVASSDAKVATATVSGNTVTVTKKGTGTATITVSVAEGTNHTAPANKNCTVACKTIPTLAEGNTWYKGTAAEKTAITQIEIANTYSGAATKSWDASAAQDGSVKAYVNGTKLIIAGNGYGKVLANANSTSAFNAFTNVTSLIGLNKLDTSNVTNMQTMFNNLDNIQTLDLSSFNTSKVTNFYSIFGGNDKLTTLNLTGWDTSAAKDMGQMFYVCNALTTINGLSSFNTANVTDMSGMFHGCKAMSSLDLRNFNTTKVKNMSYMFYQNSNLETVELSSFDTSNVTNMRAMFWYCNKLQTVTLGKSFKFVGTDSYLPEPSSTYISGATGNWYVEGLGNTPCYTPAELAAVTRVRTVTYTAIPTSTGGGGGTGSEFDVDWPKQRGMLTYNGSVQSPTWDGYIPSKMTLGGTTSGTNAGSYTATFTPRDGYCWPDGTADTVSVTWKIGKAAGSLSISRASATIDYDATTTTFTVTRAGDGAISVTSSAPEVATATVSGNTVTVTKKGAGTTTITVSVAEGTNYTAPASKTCTVTCKILPILAAGDTWYKGTKGEQQAITQIEIADTYSGAATKSWDASAAQDGSVKAYVNGTKLIIAGNGYGKVLANANSSKTFSGFTALTSIAGIKKLDTSNVTSMGSMFFNCMALTSLDLSSFDTSQVTNMSSMFNGCSKLTSLDISSFDTSKVTKMDDMFSGCKKLTSLDVSSFDTSKVTNMSSMFYGCWALTRLNVFNSATSQVTNMSSMFNGCSKLTSLDLSSFDTSKVTNMSNMFSSCSGLTGLDVSSFDTSRVIYMNSMFGGCSTLTSLDLSSFDNSKVTNMRYMFNGCSKLQAVTLSTKFKFVGTYSYLPTPSSTYISGADGKWYDTTDGTGYTPAELAGVTRTETRTYVAIPNTEQILVPEQLGTLTYNGGVQEPVWSGYDPVKMTFSGTTSGTNAGSYTATFTPKTNYKWSDGTTAAKSVTWKIGKAAGSLTLSTFSATIYDPTTTFAVTRAGDGAISVESSAPAVATATVSGNTVTVTKKGTGTATITVSVAEGTNYTAPADKTCAVTCKPIPVLAEGSTWYKGTAAKSTITQMELIDNGKPSGTISESWDASAAQDGSVMAYIVGTKLTLSGNGYGKIVANAKSHHAFSQFTALTDIAGMKKLDTSNVTNMWVMFGDCNALTSLDVSNFDTSNVTTMNGMFVRCNALTSLDLSNWDVSKVRIMGAMFFGCNALTSVGDLSGWNTASLTDLLHMFVSCDALTSLDLSGWDTSKVTSMSGMFSGCDALTSLDLSGWSTASVNVSEEGLDTMNDMFEECNKLQTVTLGKDFKFVGTKGYLPTPSSTYISGADGKWYDTAVGTGYTPAELAGVTRTEDRTYVAKSITTLAAQNTWYKGTTAKSTITQIELVDSGKPSGTISESWDASAAQDGSVMAYIVGTKLTLSGNGYGKIMANAKSNTAFRSFTALTSITGLEILDTSMTTNMAFMFGSCGKLTNLDLSTFDTSAVTATTYMFSGCSSLTDLNLSNWDTSNVTTMAGMFGQCSNLTSLDLSGWNTAKATYMSSMFFSCKNLQKIYVSDLWTTASVTSSDGMFNGCVSLSGKIAYDASKTDAAYANYTNGYLTYKAAPTK